MEPEVEEWLDSLPPVLFAVVASRVDYLADVGTSIRMPRSRALGDGHFELGRLAQRITCFFPGEGRIVLLTVFRKQRQNERAEVARARLAMRVRVEQAHTADEEDE